LVTDDDPVAGFRAVSNCAAVRVRTGSVDAVAEVPRKVFGGPSPVVEAVKSSEPNLTGGSVAVAG
jgi:hypothetical protein